MRSISQNIDRMDVVLNEPNLVANAGLVTLATLAVPLGLERLIDQTMRLVGRVGGANPARRERRWVRRGKLSFRFQPSAT